MPYSRRPHAASTRMDGAGFLAELWLKWPERAATATPPASLRYILEGSRGLGSEAFAEHVQNVRRDLKLDDITSLIAEFRHKLWHTARAGGSLLAAVYNRVLDADAVVLAFDCGCPMVLGEPVIFERWARIIDFFDPDNFIALTVAKRARSAPPGPEFEHMLDQWPLVISSADTDLRRLFAMGLSDLHLHMKSLWPASLSWQRVLRHGAELGDGRRIDDGYAAHKLSAYAGRHLEGSAAVGIEMRLIEEARRAISKGGPLSFCRPADIPFLSQNERLPARPRDVLRAERVMLLQAWQHIICRNWGWERLEVALDRYLLAKNLFRVRHMQSVRATNPGLSAFDVTRRHNSYLGRFAREEASSSGFSEARFRMNNGVLIGALLECGSLVRAELRIAPPETAPSRMAAGYGRTMLASRRLLVCTQAPSGREPVDIKFAIHFKRAPRSIRPAGSSHTLPTMAVLRKLMDFDLESAALQDFRYRASTGRWRQDSDMLAAGELIGRLDLAGPERGAGPWLAAPYIRLLRGHADALAGLDHAAGNPYLTRWHTLHRQGRVRPACDLPRLALTCHAGEDFYTLIDGLWSIDSAIETWNLGPGDGIGHCLALGVDAHDCATRRLDGVRLPAGVELDSLIWLHSFLEQNGLAEGRQRHDLLSHIIDRATDCYGDVLRLRTAETPSKRILYEKIENLHLPVPACAEHATNRFPSRVPPGFFLSLSGGDFLRAADLFDAGVAQYRFRLVPPAQIHRDLIEVLHEVQNRLVAKIRTRGIVIETNPSSNMRMERAPDVAALPVMKLLLRTNSPRVTVCSDNPGTYDTNIEAEYSLLFSGLMAQLNGNRDRALEILYKLRDDMRHVNWFSQTGVKDNKRNDKQ